MDRPREILISVEDLFLDELNPRLDGGQSQDLILATWARDPKTYRIAADMAEFGPNPLKRLAVIPHAELADRYVAVEGNRRVAAMKLLNQPSLAPDTATVKRFAKLAKERQSTIPTSLPCVVATRADWERWIELEHSGPSDGVGTLPWEALQKTRFNVRRGKADPNADAMRLLDLAHENRWISKAQQEKVPITNLSRLLGDRRARALLGIQRVVDGPPIVARSAREARKVIATLVAALSETSVRQLDKSDDRVRFALEQLAVAGAKAGPLEGTEPGEPDRGRKPATKKRAGAAKARDTFMPKQLGFTISHDRCFDIADELQRRLKVKSTPNAIVILFRVFLELTTDYYLDKRGKTPSPNTSLFTKIERCLACLATVDVAYDLKLGQRQALSKVLGRPNHPLHPDTLNAFVHNAYLSPPPSELPHMWDQIAPFVSAVWRALEEPKS